MKEAREDEDAGKAPVPVDVKQDDLDALIEKAQDAASNSEEEGDDA